MAEQYLTSSTFDAFMQQKGLSLVVFTASWCAPCQDLKKSLALLEQEEKDFSIAYVDIEKEVELRESFEIKTVPWIMLVRDAIVLFSESGSLTIAALRDLLQQARQLNMDEVKQQGQE